MLTNPSSLSIKAGLRAGTLPANLELKWIDFEFLSDRNVSNFVVKARGGEPGGEGGMAVLGTDGKVRS